MQDIKETLKLCEVYWREGFDGNHTNAQSLKYYSLELKKQDDDGKIDRNKLSSTERQTLNRLLILANC